MNAKLKAAVPLLLVLVAAAWGLFAPPLLQSQDYHRFADARAWLSVANAADTLSNFAFLIVGGLGLAFLWRERKAGSSAHFSTRGETTPYAVFFAGVALTSVGSAYYHLAPDDARLVWDRLPMTVAFMSLVSAAIAERISVRAGGILLVPLLIAGVASVVYWRASALGGFENLRPYMAVQYGSIGAVLAISLLFRSRYTHGYAIFLLAAAYIVAKQLETYDRAVYELGFGLSGHTLKHLVAALGLWILLRSLQRREIRRQPAPAHGAC